MKKTITLFLIIPLICSGQVQFNFESQGITEWITSRTLSWDTSSVEPISGRYSLKHNYDNPESGHDQASFHIDSLHPEAGFTEWQFRIRHGYDPSSSNNWSVYLIADADATRMFPGGKASGYAVGVNYTGSDDLLKLWKINREVSMPVINTGLNWQEKIGINSAGIKVIRSPEGIWQIFIKSRDSVYSSVGEGMDEELINVRDFGVYYEYSAKQDCKLWLDDISISGIFIQDTIPPVLNGINVSGSNTLLLSFSEPLDTNSGISLTNFYAGEYLGYPCEVSVEESNMLCLIFDLNFPDGIKCILSIEGLSDLKGNLINPSENEFIYHPAGWFDIIINEIMADPSPPIGLAEFEYIELLNRCDHEVCLTDWSISCGDITKVFPEVSLESGSFLLLVHEDAEEEFSQFGKCLPVFSSRSSLPNSGAVIELRDEKGRLISWTNYSDEWYENDYYRAGGWSLERIDPDRFCAGDENWTGSVDPTGGTPGRTNTSTGISSDTIDPGILYVEIPGESVIEVFFSEPMDSTTLLFPENYIIDHGIGNPVRIELKYPEYHSVLLFLSRPLEEGLIYRMKINGDLKDCAANIIEWPDSVQFARPEPAGVEDILISEIMFDPLSGYPEFIELYNNSSKTIDLSNIIIAEKDIQTGGMVSFTTICETHRLYFPGEFLILTKDKLDFLIGYPNALGTIIGLSDLFSFDDEQGTILILDKWLQVLDEFSYDNDMHFSLLTSTEGVSLERISYERSSSNRDNWHSAAKDAGFCTPGYENSQFVITSDRELTIGIEPEIFTPDNDGREDVINICYSFDKPGNVISIWIFDPMGRMIRQLALNLLSGTSGCILWDGTDDNGRRANMGIYLVYIRIFDLDGKVSHIKKTCVLSIRK
jgi:hypothetical protein